ncbi:uncharacterized protein Z520_09414 [Fonsecaea multimorphosa CBS 102226]|uniref:Transcription factor domain-containing protein n=1 Tax=Fonsecaea multimorphosa CBS 102226 TaxID=1442371 RepID=A0A0D2JW41_9EURO|nr:uncharacterized protein Z520_09414 [Fonsecaea multimorphosa CBS 102226]KIX94724.1 hypothetical protein Z520_09414 [Fonsecaea multimorphosa CBS 102226]
MAQGPSPQDKDPVASQAGAEQQEQQQQYQFIAVSPGRETRPSAETRRLVHSHAQANYRRRQGPHHLQRRQRQTTWEVDVSPLLSKDDSTAAQNTSGGITSSTATTAGQSTGAVAISPVSLLAANRSDPFQSFGIEAGSRAHRLWDHVYDGTCAKFRTLIDIGFIDLVRETIAVSQMLSASAWHLVHWCRTEDDSGEDARYALITTRSLQQRLNNLATGTSDEVITTVLAAAAYANLIKQTQIFQVHMDGLAKILHHRGGEQTLDSTAGLRLSMFWIETNGRFLQDAAPRYRPPYRLLARRSRLDLDMTDVSLLSHGENFDTLEQSEAVRHICQQLRRLNHIMDEECTRRDLWHDSPFAVFHVSPILHDCLSIAHGTLRDEIQLRQRECFRLASILYLCEIRAKFDFEPGAGMLYGTKLQLMMGTEGLLPRWERSNNVFLLWILTVAACSATLFDDLRTQFVSRLAECIHAAGIANVDDFCSIIYDFTWSRGAFGPALSSLAGTIRL